jgi:hypothetical protein
MIKIPSIKMAKEIASAMVIFGDKKLPIVHHIPERIRQVNADLDFVARRHVMAMIISMRSVT